MKLTLRNIKIDVKDNEKEVLEFLHYNHIFERGEITCPSKDIWFNFCHYIKFNSTYPCLDKNGNHNWLYYTYTNKNQEYQSKLLKTITFEELKTFILNILR